MKDLVVAKSAVIERNLASFPFKDLVTLSEESKGGDLWRKQKKITKQNKAI